MKEKEFGNLSVKQVREFHEVFCKFFDEFTERCDEPDEQIADVTIIWHPLYELELKQIALYFLSVLRIEEEIRIGIEKGDVYQHIIELLKSGYDSPFKKEDLDSQSLVNLSSCFICMCMNFVCFSGYRTDIHNLVREARAGCKDSIFKAINIDPTVVSTETAAGLIAKAHLEDDNDFFEMLSKAVKGGYPQKPSQKYPVLNFFVHLIDDAAGGAIDYQALHHLFTEQIPLYPNAVESKDSFGSFKKHLDRTRHKVKDIKS